MVGTCGLRHMCLILLVLFCRDSFLGAMSFHCIDPVSDCVDSIMLPESEDINLIFCVPLDQEIVNISHVFYDTVFYWQKLNESVIGKCFLNASKICVTEIDANFEINIQFRYYNPNTLDISSELRYLAIDNITLKIPHSDIKDLGTYSLKIEGENCTLFSKTVTIMNEHPSCSTFYQKEYHAVKAVCTWMSRDGVNERAKLVGAGKTLSTYQKERMMNISRPEINKLSVVLTLEDICSEKRIPETCIVNIHDREHSCKFSTLMLNGVHKITKKSERISLQFPKCNAPVEWWIIGRNIPVPIGEREQVIEVSIDSIEENGKYNLILMNGTENDNGILAYGISKVVFDSQSVQAVNITIDKDSTNAFTNESNVMLFSHNYSIIIETIYVRDNYPQISTKLRDDSAFLTTNSMVNTPEKDSKYAELKPEVYLIIFSTLAVSLLAVLINIGMCLRQCKCHACDNSSNINTKMESGTRRHEKEERRMTPQQVESSRQVDQVELSGEDTGRSQCMSMSVLQGDGDYSVPFEDTCVVDTTVVQGSLDDLIQNFTGDEAMSVSKKKEGTPHSNGSYGYEHQYEDTPVCDKAERYCYMEDSLESLTKGCSSQSINLYGNTLSCDKSEMYCSTEDLDEILAKGRNAQCDDIHNFPTENGQWQVHSLYCENFDETVTDGDFVPIKESVKEADSPLEVPGSVNQSKIPDHLYDRPLKIRESKEVRVSLVDAERALLEISGGIMAHAADQYNGWNKRESNPFPPSETINMVVPNFRSSAAAQNSTNYDPVMSAPDTNDPDMTEDFDSSYDNVSLSGIST